MEDQVGSRSENGVGVGKDSGNSNRDSSTIRELGTARRPDDAFRSRQVRWVAKGDIHVFRLRES